MKPYLENQIRQREERLAALGAERSKVEAELAAYRDALAQLVRASPNAGAEAPALSIPKKGAGRGLSQAWLLILAELSKHTRFTSFEVALVARELQIDQKGVNIRSQLSNYADKGVIRRMGLGRYIVSEATKQMLCARKLLPEKPVAHVPSRNSTHQEIGTRTGGSGP